MGGVEIDVLRWGLEIGLVGGWVGLGSIGGACWPDGWLLSEAAMGLGLGGKLGGMLWIVCRITRRGGRFALDRAFTVC